MKNLLHASAAEVREQAAGQHVLVSPHHVTVAAGAAPARAGGRRAACGR